MAEGLNGDRVLIVDDDAQMRTLLARLVSADGLACDTAGSVPEAREAFRPGEHTLVLLDVNLPGESGLGLARELASRTPAPAVLMISGQDDAEVAAHALEAGAYGYLTKPFKPNEISIALHEALRRRKLQMESQSQRARLEDRVVAGTAALNEALVRLNVAHEETVLRLAKAIEYRDPETGSHIERMSHYCALLGESFDLDPEAMRLASRLHDVGKISIADSILLKPGPLTPEERREMERHAEIGYRVLRGSQSQILDLAATIAWTHHERFDGSGYPRGLRGDAIPLPGQIAGLADMFDALTTDRVYRSARSVEEAVALLAAERGTGFAEVIFDAFVAKLGEVEAIMARFDGEPATPQDPVVAEESSPQDLLSLQEAAATVAPPAGGLTAVADVLRARGPEIVQRAAASLYEQGEGGWFLADEETTGTRSWLSEVMRACETGRHAGALEATRLLMQRAHLQGATPFEQHGFLEHFGDTMQGLLVAAGVGSSEIAASRRLWTSHRQALLAARG